MNVGEQAQRSLTVDDDLVSAFAEVSGDRNPVHMEEEYAAKTRFGRRIAHGMIAGSLISATLANDLPGPGTVYLSQQLTFRAPVFIGDVITATVEVMTWDPVKRFSTLSTTCSKQDGTIIVSGEASVLVDEAP